MLWKLECMVVYQTRIWIYDQISILTIWSKVKLHHPVSLMFGLKEGKIALNITKFGMNSYLPNGHLNLRSNFNSKKLVKSETPSSALTKVALKGTENSLECLNVGVHACLLKLEPKSTLKFQLWKKLTKVHIFDLTGTKFDWGPK